MSKAEETVTKKKVASKKKVAKKQAASKPATKKSASPKSTGTPKSSLVSPRERYKMIATMAYYRAEQRDFEPGHDVEDWLDCERIIDSMLSS